MAISWVFHSLHLAHIMFVLRRLQALSHRPLMVFTIHRVFLDVRDAHSVLHGYHFHDARGVHGPHTVHGVHGVHHVRDVHDARDVHEARDVHDAHGAVHGVLHDDGWKIVLNLHAGDTIDHLQNRCKVIVTNPKLYSFFVCFSICPSISCSPTPPLPLSLALSLSPTNSLTRG